MSAYEATYTRLIEKGFLKIKEDGLSSFGVALFRQEHHHVIIQNFEEGMKLADIKEESIRIREKLHQLKINVWNTYYILCADGHMDLDENPLFIERDPTGLRKYFIEEEADLNRIPFLDNQAVNEINNPIQIKDNVLQSDKKIKVIFDFIERNHGTEKVISEEEIELFIDKIR